jgi:hypothetical protein
MAKTKMRERDRRAAKKTPKPAKQKAVHAAIPVPPQQTVEDYVSKVAPWQRTVIEKLRTVVRAAAPRASEAIKWSQPVYEHKGPFAYIKAHAASVNFGFWRGAELDDPKRLLQGLGDKMRHVKIVEAQVLDEPTTVTLAAFVEQAFKLNDKKGDPTKD